MPLPTIDPSAPKMETENGEKLLARLLENKNWPLKYMFKFIVPNTQGKVQCVVDLLPTNSEIKYNHTPSLKYVAVTCVAMMESADSIVEITTRATSIQGVMAL